MKKKRGRPRKIVSKKKRGRPYKTLVYKVGYIVKETTKPTIFARQIIPGIFAIKIEFCRKMILEQQENDNNTISLYFGNEQDVVVLVRFKDVVGELFKKDMKITTRKSIYEGIFCSEKTWEKLIFD